ncbi:MAG: hypothetical protein Q8882_04250 [Bacillota bacterium]|nr:hypothetical protein [Bacillota bacterium]
MTAKFFKYNEDDILEILLETICKENDFYELDSKGVLLVNDKDEVTFIGIFDESYDKLKKIDFDEVNQSMEYNGTHDGSGFSSLAELSEALKKAIDTGDF